MRYDGRMVVGAGIGPIRSRLTWKGPGRAWHRSLALRGSAAASDLRPRAMGLSDEVLAAGKSGNCPEEKKQGLIIKYLQNDIRHICRGLICNLLIINHGWTRGQSRGYLARLGRGKRASPIDTKGTGAEMAENPGEVQGKSLRSVDINGVQCKRPVGRRGWGGGSERGNEGRGNGGKKKSVTLGEETKDRETRPKDKD